MAGELRTSHVHSFGRSNLNQRISYTYNPTTTSALDMLIFLPYVASKDADYP